MNWPQDFKNGPLSQLLSQFQSQNNRYFDEIEKIEPEENKKPEAVQASSNTMFQTQQLIPQGPAYGFIPMPVDYETYCRWMTQFGQQGSIAPGKKLHLFDRAESEHRIENAKL